MLRFSLLVLLALLTACGGEPPAMLNLGDPAPAFRTQRLDGGEVDFPAAAAGRPRVVRFWADWCRYCEAEMKAIETVYQRHRERGLEVFAVNAGQDRTAVAAFIKKLGVTYPVLLDEKSSIAKRYGVVGLPTTYFVDANGVVRGKVIGEADEAVFERHVQALLQ
ncbi:MAG: TlpA family protein disulfide reductase [Caenispirillum sp.]|nr:TlpA family protein disulfide reductase [Caenispirillum sp.]